MLAEIRVKVNSKRQIIGYVANKLSRALLNAAKVIALFDIAKQVKTHMKVTLEPKSSKSFFCPVN